MFRMNLLGREFWDCVRSPGLAPALRHLRRYNHWCRQLPDHSDKRRCR